MKKIVIFILSNIFGLVFSQNKESLKTIDSLYQIRWTEAAINIDSLAEPKLSEVKGSKTHVVFNNPFTATPTLDDTPVTPFNLFRHPMKRWFYYGNNRLIFNQSSFSNWNSGGNNNIGIIAKINYNISYKKNKHYWENIFQMGYGLVYNRGEELRKTEDQINIMTNYGYELGHHYYLSSGIQFLSQFAPGYNYGNKRKPAFSNRVSRFMAPAYLNIGMGVSYNPTENFQMVFRPINGKFTFVLDPYLQKKGLYGLDTDRQSLRKELGAMVNILYKLKIYQRINIVNQLNFFSNYVNNPQRIDIFYSGQLNMNFNKYITGTVNLDILYDHDQIQKVQLKQTLGLGFTYNLGTENSTKSKNKKLIKPFISK